MAGGLKWRLIDDVEYSTSRSAVPDPGTRFERAVDLVAPMFVRTTAASALWVNWALLTAALAFAANLYGLNPWLQAPLLLPGCGVLALVVANVNRTKRLLPRLATSLVATGALLYGTLVFIAEVPPMSDRGELKSWHPWVLIALVVVAWRLRSAKGSFGAGHLLLMVPLAVLGLGNLEIKPFGVSLRLALVIVAVTCATIPWVARVRITWTWFWGLLWAEIGALAVIVAVSGDRIAVLSLFVGITILAVVASIAAAYNLQRRAFTIVYLAIALAVCWSVAGLGNRSEFGLDAEVVASVRRANTPARLDALGLSEITFSDAGRICRDEPDLEGTEACTASVWTRLRVGSEAVVEEFTEKVFRGRPAGAGRFASSIVLGPLPLLFLLLRRRSDRNLPARVASVVARKDGEPGQWTALEEGVTAAVRRTRLSLTATESAANEPVTIPEPLPAMAQGPVARLFDLRLQPRPAVAVNVVVDSAARRASGAVTDARSGRTIDAFEIPLGGMTTAQLAEAIGLRTVALLTNRARTVPRWDRWDKEGVGLTEYLELARQRERAEPGATTEANLKARVAAVERGLDAAPGNVLLAIAAVSDLVRDKDPWRAWLVATRAIAEHPQLCEVFFRGAWTARELSLRPDHLRQGAEKEEIDVTRSFVRPHLSTEVLWNSAEFRATVRLLSEETFDVNEASAMIPTRIRRLVRSIDHDPIALAMLMNRTSSALNDEFLKRIHRWRVLANALPISQRSTFLDLFGRRAALREYRYRGRSFRLLLDAEWLILLTHHCRQELASGFYGASRRRLVKARLGIARRVRHLSNEAAAMARIPDLGWRANKNLALFWDRHEWLRLANEDATKPHQLRPQMEAEDAYQRSVARSLSDCRSSHARHEIRDLLDHAPGADDQRLPVPFHPSVSHQSGNEELATLRAMVDELPEGIETSLTKDACSATGVVDAAPEAVFEYLCRPANHAEISGNGTVQETRVGPDLLTDIGERFGMKMKQGLPYSVTNKVVRYEANRVISWSHMMGNTWTWTLEPIGDDRTKVTETYDQAPAKAGFVLKIMGYPKGHVANVATSVANVRAHFS